MSAEDEGAKKKWLKKVAHVCPRCGMEFRAASEYGRHLERKSICPPTVADVSLQEEIDSLVVVRKKKVEETKKSKPTATTSSEKKKKKMKNEDDDDDDDEKQQKAVVVQDAVSESGGATSAYDENAAATRDVDLEARIKHCEAQLEKLELLGLGSKTTTRGGGGGGGHHHTATFGFETTYHVDDAYVRRYVDDPIQCVMKIVNDIFFNENFPENRTVRFHDGALQIRRRGGWTSLENKKEMLRRIAERAIDVIDNAISGDSLTMDQYVHDFREGDDEVTSKLLNEIDTLVFLVDTVKVPDAAL